MTPEELGAAYIQSREGLGLEDLSEESGGLWVLYLAAANGEKGP